MCGSGSPGRPLAERGQEPGVGVSPGAAQCVPVLGAQRLVQGEVLSVVDRRLDAESPAFLQIGLGLRRLVVDLDLGGGVTGDDFGGEASGRLEPAAIDHRAGQSLRGSQAASQHASRRGWGATSWLKATSSSGRWTAVASLCDSFPHIEMSSPT